MAGSPDKQWPLPRTGLGQPRGRNIQDNLEAWWTGRLVRAGCSYLQGIYFDMIFALILVL